MKRLLSVMLIAILLITFIGCAQNEAPISTEVNQATPLAEAERLMLEGNYEEAILAYNSLLEIEPRSVPAYLGLSNAYVQAGKIEEALAVLQNGMVQMQDSSALMAQWKQVFITYVGTIESRDGWLYYEGLDGVQYRMREDGSEREKHMPKPEKTETTTLSRQDVIQLNALIKFLMYVPSFDDASELNANSIYELFETIFYELYYLSPQPELRGYYMEYDRENSLATLSPNQAEALLDAILGIPLPPLEREPEIYEDGWIETPAFINDVYYFGSNDHWTYDYFVSSFANLGSDQYLVCFDLWAWGGVDAEEEEAGLHVENAWLVVQRTTHAWQFRAVSYYRDGWLVQTPMPLIDGVAREDLIPIEKVIYQKPGDLFTEQDLIEMLIMEGHQRNFERWELYRFTQEEVALIRNGMYALSGKIFSKSENADYFGEKGWYTPVAEDVDELMNVNQKENVRICARYEEERGWR